MPKSDRSYLEALRKLRSYIAENYQENGWLPSSRKLHEQFNVTRRTYLKALKCIEQDGIAKAFPKKGHYITSERFRIKKVGILINNAADCPFLHCNDILSSLLETLKAQNIYGQMIQAVDHDKLLDKALIHGVRGLVWLIPPSSAISYIKTIYKNSELPLVVVSDRHIEGVDTPDIISILPDFRLKLQKKLDYFKQKQHKKVCIIGKDDTLKNGYIPFKEDIEKTGLTPCFIRHDENGKVANLAPLSVDSDLTSLIIDCNYQEIFTILKHISELKKHFITDIHIHPNYYFDMMRAQNPNLKITATSRNHLPILGKKTAEILIDNLQNGTPLKSYKLDIQDLIELDN